MIARKERGTFEFPVTLNLFHGNENPTATRAYLKMRAAENRIPLIFLAVVGMSK